MSVAMLYGQKGSGGEKQIPLTITTYSNAVSVLIDTAQIDTTKQYYAFIASNSTAIGTYTYLAASHFTLIYNNGYWKFNGRSTLAKNDSSMYDTCLINSSSNAASFSINLSSTWDYGYAIEFINTFNNNGTQLAYLVEAEVI